MAYASDESGRWEVYVGEFPGGGGRWQISAGGGVEPRWRPDGKELFYRNEQKWMSAEVNLKGEFKAEKPRLLFEGHYEASDTGAGGYDVTSDRRFLMIESISPQRPVTHITVVLNWFEELKRTIASDTK